jgi:hypothetical protein
MPIQTLFEPLTEGVTFVACAFWGMPSTIYGISLSSAGIVLVATLVWWILDMLLLRLLYGDSMECLSAKMVLGWLTREVRASLPALPRFTRWPLARASESVLANLTVPTLRCLLWPPTLMPLPQTPGSPAPPDDRPLSFYFL